MTLAVLGGMLLFCLGLLLGTAWSLQAVQPKLNLQAKERRRLNEEWLAVRAAQQQRDMCQHCGNSLHDWGWHIAPTAVTDRLKDDRAA